MFSCLNLKLNKKVYFRANVILTDLPEALPLLQLNIDENRKTLSNFGSNVVASPLIWGDQNDLKVIPDKIVLADCVYYQEVYTKFFFSIGTYITKFCFSQLYL